MSNNNSNNILNKIPPKTNGKKLLITLKNAQNTYNNYANSSIEDYYNFMEQNDDFIKEYKEIIENEEEEINLNKKNENNNIEENSQIMISDIDSMLKEIQELKSRINDFKLKNKIKTKRDYLKYMNLIDKNSNNDNNNNNDKINILYKSQNKFYNKLEKSFKKNNEEEKYSQYKKYLIPKESQKEKDFINIKEKLQKQEDSIKKFEESQLLKEKEKEKENQENQEINSNEADIYFNINNKYTGDEDVDKLFNEIKLADMKMDSYLRDIDECLLLNENIEKQLDEDEQINEENKEVENNLNNNKNNNN